MAWQPDYVQVDDLAEYARIDDDNDDAQIALAITAASRAIDRHCRRQFGLVDTAQARFYPPRQDRCRGWLVDVDDLMTTTGLLVDGVAPVSSVLLPRNAAAEGRPWTTLVLETPPEDEVEVTARWGWSTVPTTVKQACLLQASRLLTRREAPFGIAGSPDAGSEMRLLAKVDPDVQVTLEAFRKKARPR